MSSPPEQEAVTLYRAPTGLHGADQWREVPVPWRADRMRERSNYEVEQFVPLARLEAAEAEIEKLRAQLHVESDENYRLRAVINDLEADE